VSWQPFLEGDDAARARAAIATIAERLAAIELDDPSLAGGAAGVALLHAQLAREGDDAAGERAYDAFAAALRAVPRAQGPWLASGHLGVGFAAAQLDDLIELDEGVLPTFDRVAADLLAPDAWPLDYELLYGLVGVGVYARARGRDELVARAAWHLDRLATRDGAGATWWTRADGAADPRGFRDLGLAHGAAGAIALAAIAGARPLLHDAVPALLACARDGKAPVYPMQLGLARPDQLRNGWCYGDLAIACALVAAGRAAAEPAWIEHGRALARAHAAGPIDDVPDVGVTLCHGTAGRAHLLARLARATDDAALLAAARRHAIATLDRLPTLDLGRPSLLTGATGVALVLHAAVSTIEPRWDRALLVELPPAQTQIV
jgi:hypothetical protein